MIGTGVTRRALWALAIAFVLSRVVLGFFALHLDRYGHDHVFVGNDVFTVYQGWAEGVIYRGEAPYSGVSIEYPPGALPFAFLPEAISPDEYQLSFVQLMHLVDLAGLLGLLTLARRGRSLLGPWLWVVGIFLLGPIALLRLDLVPAVLAIWGFERASARRWDLAGGLFGFAVLTKVYPLAFFPALLAQARERKRLLTGAAIAMALPLVPLLGSLDDMMTNVAGYHLNRGIQIESLWASLILMARLFGRRVDVVLDFGAFHVVNYPEAIGHASRVLLLGAIVCGIWLARRVEDPSLQRQAEVAFATLLLVVALATVFSPQFIIWLIGAGAIVLCARGTKLKIPALLVLPAAVLTQWLFPFNYGGIVETNRVSLAVLITRNLLVLFTGIAALFAVLESEDERTEEPEIGDEPPGEVTWWKRFLTEGLTAQSTRFWLIVAGVAGIALRIYLLQTPLGDLDSDEGVWGLMVKQALHGDFYTFFHDQQYGGTVQVLLSAPFVALLGTTATAIRIVPLLLHVAGCLLTWRVGRRTIGEWPARLAAALVWVWPTTFVWFSIKERGFYGIALVSSLAVVLLALRLREEPRHLDMALLGLALGVGWWATPLVVCSSVPVLAWLVWKRPSILMRAWVALPPFVLGALPWIWTNLEHGFASFDVSYEPGVPNKYVDHIAAYLRQAIPGALGLRVSRSDQWILGPVFGLVAYLLLVTVIALYVRKRGVKSEPLVWIVLGFPLVLALNPLSWYVVEPRYFYTFAPFAALLIAGAFNRRVLVHVVTAALILLSVVGAPLTARVPLNPAPDIPGPSELEPLFEALETEGIDAAFAQYWLAYRIAYESNEEIIATPLFRERYKPYSETVRAADRSAYVFVDGSSVADTFRQEMDARDIAYEELPAEGFEVYVPERPVFPEEVPAVQV